MTVNGRTREAPQSPAYERTAVYINNYIAQHDLKAGDKLPTERELGKTLGVSRTVLREAIKALEATGILRVRQGSGIYIADHTQAFASAVIQISAHASPQDVTSLYEFRIALEVQTAQLAAQRITPHELEEIRAIQAAFPLAIGSGDIERLNELDMAFHGLIAAASHNPYFESAITTAMKLNHWAIHRLATTEGSFLVAAEQHGRVLAAISQGDGEGAAQEMTNHLTFAQRDREQEIRRRLFDTP